eukprot:gene3250-2232_t
MCDCYWNFVVPYCGFVMVVFLLGVFACWALNKIYVVVFFVGFGSLVYEFGFDSIRVAYCV